MTVDIFWPSFRSLVTSFEMKLSLIDPPFLYPSDDFRSQHDQEEEEEEEAALHAG